MTQTNSSIILFTCSEKNHINFYIKSDDRRFDILKTLAVDNKIIKLYLVADDIDMLLNEINLDEKKSFHLKEYFNHLKDLQYSFFKVKAADDIVNFVLNILHAEKASLNHLEFDMLVSSAIKATNNHVLYHIPSFSE